MILPHIPEDKLTAPWVQTLIQIIQTQTEQIAALKTTVQELRDEIAKLKNTPKRPKFRPNGKFRKKDKNSTSSNDNTSSVDKVMTTPKAKFLLRCVL